MHHHGHSLIVCQQEQCTRLYSEEELPAEFKLYLPVQQKGGHQVKQFCSLMWNCVAGSRGRCCCTRRGGSTNNAVVFASTLSHVNHKQLSNMKLRPATLFVTIITSNGQKNSPRNLIVCSSTSSVSFCIKTSSHCGFCRMQRFQCETVGLHKHL